MGDLVQGIGIDRRVPVITGRGMFTIPDRASGTELNSSVTPYVYGSWVELGAPLPWDLFIHAIMLGPCSASSNEVTFHLQLGAGAAGNEAPISTFKLENVQVITFEGMDTRTADWLPYPIWVPAWTRIAGRASSDSGAANPRRVSLNVSRTRDEAVYV